MATGVPQGPTYNDVSNTAQLYYNWKIIHRTTTPDL